MLTEHVVEIGLLKAQDGAVVGGVWPLPLTEVMKLAWLDTLYPNYMYVIFILVPCPLSFYTTKHINRLPM